MDIRYFKSLVYGIGISGFAYILLQVCEPSEKLVDELKDLNKQRVAEHKFYIQEELRKKQKSEEK